MNSKTTINVGDLMAEKEIDKLTLVKEQIVDNLDVLLARVDECTEIGMKDYDAALYNQIISLQEDVGPLDTFEELEMIIVRAKTVETAIDRWQASQGESTLGLDWPELSPKPPVIE